MDFSLSFILIVISIPIIFLIFSVLYLFNSQPKQSKRKALFLLFGSSKNFKEKGVFNQIFIRDLDGYFDHVYTFHEFAKENLTIKPKPQHTIKDFGPTLNAKWLKYTSYILTELRILFEGYKLIQKEGICVVRAHDPFISGINALLLARVNKIPVIFRIGADYRRQRQDENRITLAAIPFLGNKSVEQALENFFYHNVDLIITPTESLKTSVISVGAPKDKVKVSHISGTTSNFFKKYLRFSKKPTYTKKGKHIVSFISRLHREKYPEDVVNCAKEILKRRDDIIFLVAGGGPLRDKLERNVKKENISNIVFLGFIPENKVYELLLSSDVVVSPLTGNSLREAALFGAPVVAYDYDWQPEIIFDGETGLLVPYRDYKAMAKSVIKLIDHPKFAKRLGKNLKEFMFKTDNPSKMISKERKIYDELFLKWKFKRRS